MLQTGDVNTKRRGSRGDRCHGRLARAHGQDGGATVRVRTTGILPVWDTAGTTVILSAFIPRVLVRGRDDRATFGSRSVRKTFVEVADAFRKG